MNGPFKQPVWLMNASGYRLVNSLWVSASDILFLICALNCLALLCRTTFGC